ncbi:hypothetical protein [Vibrio sinaloensis]|uniref:hypothetical protein n=1 Tax=Photobacterium sp. (strain ATCC 43367) TaxID=379097 RepID=UPI002061C125|nr:hypothetical protein [Vibrio sinaloensis]UPQ89426.1 hypothetical protein MTO69_16830 [Vibrio sinaloensis]
MKLLTKTLIATALVASSAQATFAQDAVTDKIDPSDLTQVSTSGYVGMNNQGDVKLSASFGFGITEGQMGMATIEGTIDDDGNYSDSRAQYFQVFNTGNSIAPKAAVSLDIIDNTNFTTAAVGAISMFNPGIENFVIFGRVGVLAGQYDKGFTQAMGETDKDIVGGMAAAYLSWKTGADGTYLMFSPEYTYMDGSIETSTLKTSLTVGTPLSADGKRWGQFKLENTYGSMESSKAKIDIDDTVAWAFYKVYF